MNITIDDLIKKLREAKKELGGKSLVEFYDYSHPMREFGMCPDHFKDEIRMMTASRTIKGPTENSKSKVIRFCVKEII